MLPASTPSDIYVLAHPDDDIFVRPLIKHSLRKCCRVIIMYLTDGAAGGRFDPSRRKTEATAALRSLGVDADDIHFSGIACGIPDGLLFEHLELCLSSVLATLVNNKQCLRLISHAWEGGHPDHDAAHLIARVVARRLGCLEESLVFPSYRAADAGLLPFAVCSPLVSNGPQCDQRICLQESLETLAAIRYYRSQWLTFVGLGPGLVFQYCSRRSIPLQQMKLSCAPQRPMPGTLLAERRFKADWQRCSRIADAFLFHHENAG
jgi:LmbE family N-acetylglucosaminyl deacetylase